MIEYLRIECLLVKFWWALLFDSNILVWYLFCLGWVKVAYESGLVNCLLTLILLLIIKIKMLRGFLNYWRRSRFIRQLSPWVLWVKLAWLAFLKNGVGVPFSLRKLWVNYWCLSVHLSSIVGSVEWVGKFIKMIWILVINSLFILNLILILQLFLGLAPCNLFITACLLLASY